MPKTTKLTDEDAETAGFLGKKGRNWVFTFNNPDGHIDWPETVKYAIYQLEMGEKGTEHFQGYVEFNAPVSGAYLKKIDPRISWQKRRGTQEQARSYCTPDTPLLCRDGKTKTETGEFLEGPWEFGEYIPHKPGQRNDLNTIRDKIKQGISMQQIKEEHFGSFLRYEKAFWEYYNEVQLQKLQKPDIELFPWQKELVTILDGEPVHRKIYWVWSRESDIGKSTFRKWLQAHYKEKFMRGCAKLWDTLLVYRDHRIVLYDIPRQTPLDAEFTSQLEEMSDGGVVVSTKYNTMQKVVNAHIVVFCNRPPPEDKLPKRLIEFCVDIN